MTSEVADDAPLGDLPYTAADVVAAASGTFEETVEADEGDWSAATLVVARGEGPAVFADATAVQPLVGNPFYSNYDLDPTCGDAVEVPVSVTLVAEELGVDLVVDAMLAPSSGPAAPEGLETVALYVDVPRGTPGLPTPTGGSASAGLQAEFLDGELLSMRLSWQSSGDILRFPASFGAK